MTSGSVAILTCTQAIAAGKYRVITISPELLNDRQCSDLWNITKFTDSLQYFVYDEGHCISQWGSTFRNDYLHVGNIRHLLPRRIPVYVASATLPPPVLRDVSNILRLHPDRTQNIIRSNDRPNIHLVVREMKHAIGSYKDLSFLIPKNFKVGDPPPKPFLCFVDSTTSTEDATRYLQSLLPEELRHKIKWFHSTMTTAYRQEEYEAFKNGDLWGLVVTDAFGMVRSPEVSYSGLVNNPLGTRSS